MRLGAGWLCSEPAAGFGDFLLIVAVVSSRITAGGSWIEGCWCWLRVGRLQFGLGSESYQEKQSLGKEKEMPMAVGVKCHFGL
jgi:hypothetical protein